MNILEASGKRITTKEYNDKKIDQSTIEYIMEATNNAPSSVGVESTRYVVVERGNINSKLKSPPFNTTKFDNASQMVYYVTKKISVIHEDYVKSEIRGAMNRKFAFNMPEIIE